MSTTGIAPFATPVAVMAAAVRGGASRRARAAAGGTWPGSRISIRGLTPSSWSTRSARSSQSPTRRTRARGRGEGGPLLGVPFPAEDNLWIGACARRRARGSSPTSSPRPTRLRWNGCGGPAPSRSGSPPAPSSPARAPPTRRSTASRATLGTGAHARRLLRRRRGRGRGRPRSRRLHDRRRRLDAAARGAYRPGRHEALPRPRAARGRLRRAGVRQRRRRSAGAPRR